MVSGGDGIRIVATAAPTISVQLSRQESWRLYVLLADDAPFVRHQLNANRHNGLGTVSLSTMGERRQVLGALLRAATNDDPLTDGLGALKIALSESNYDGA